jgi:hypothetical protein
MRHIVSISMVVVVALGLAGCASTPPASSPCGSCKWSARNTQGPAGDPVVYCVVDGKKMDCRKSPPECPECAKAMQSK